MSGINEWLADYYGTDGMSKEASAEDTELWHLFKHAAAEDGIDVDQLSDDDVDALAAHYLNEEAAEGEGELPPNWDEGDVDNYNNLDDTEKTAFVQFKEAEFLGQVMAHSMFSEMDKVARFEKTKERYGKAKKWTGEKARAGWAGTKKLPGRAASASGLRDIYEGGKSMGQGAGAGYKGERDFAKLIGQKATMGEKLRGAARAAKPGAKQLARGTGRAGVVGLAGYGGYKALSKEAEAFEAVAEQRALNFLKEAGVEFEDDYDTDDVIDQRAVEMLIENGYGELLE